MQQLSSVFLAHIGVRPVHPSLVNIEPGETNVCKEMKTLVLESTGTGEINHVHARHIAIALRRQEFIGDEVGHKVAHDHGRGYRMLV